MSLTRIGALIAQGETEKAKQEIVEAFIGAEGDRTKAAGKLGISDPRSIYHWLDRIPGGWDAVDTALEERGMARPAGPPRKIDKIIGALVDAKGNVAKAARALETTSAELLGAVERFGIREAANRALAEAGAEQLPAPRPVRRRRAA